jgi:hypothetical protein
MAAQDAAAAAGIGAAAASGAITPAGWLMAGSQVLSGYLGGQARQPNTSTALSETTVYSFMDSSGWTVATGSAKADGATVSKGVGADIANAAGGLMWPLLLVGMLAGIYIWKRA